MAAIDRLVFLLQHERPRTSRFALFGLPDSVVANTSAQTRAKTLFLPSNWTCFSWTKLIFAAEAVALSCPPPGSKNLQNPLELLLKILVSGCCTSWRCSCLALFFSPLFSSQRTPKLKEASVGFLKLNSMHASSSPSSQVKEKFFLSCDLCPLAHRLQTLTAVCDLTLSC